MERSGTPKPEFFAVKPQKMRKKRLKKANADTPVLI
jgi:hypothetical protein